MRNNDEVQTRFFELFDRVWYIQHKRLESEGKDVSTGLVVASKIEDMYGIESLQKDIERESVLTGEMSALRWTLEGEWGDYDAVTID
jgi:hypothetical protein